jgi:DNA-binding transcriptional ArsR family regulator
MSGNRNGRPPIDLTLWGISDPEILAIVDDLADENGWTSTLDVRYQMGERPGEADQSSRSGVGPRLSWLVRYGWLERGDLTDKDESGKRWQTYRLTAMGHALVDDPKLSRSIESALQKLNPAQRLQLTRELGEGGASAASEIRTALRRQWQRSLGVGRPT